jgi:chemotaxis protein CheZ
MAAEDEANALKKELIGLFKYIQRVRQEIAAIDHPVDADHDFDSMGEQLDAIVQATEEATNTIMGAVESNSDMLRDLRKEITDPAQLALLDKIEQNGNTVFEACSFQDITGQRITKVVKSVTYVEARVDALIEIWGKAEVEKIEVKPDREKTEDEKLLSGPQLKKDALAQDDIDAMLSDSNGGDNALAQDEIDKLFG